jgi:cytidylate kinase
MAIITISRGTYSFGKEIAEHVAQRLGYTCISRDLLLETSEQFNIPEIKLVRALHDAPSLLDRFTYGKERYIAFIEATLLEEAQKDNIVYHGLAGHFILRELKHILNIRIIANIDDRVGLEMQREGISRDEALNILRKDDHERRQWSLRLFGIDAADASLYDLVIHIGKISVDAAVDIICRTAQSEAFQTTPESQLALDNMTLAAKVRAKLVPVTPTATVTSKNGTVFVNVKASLNLEHEITGQIKDLVETVPGVQDVKVNIMPVGMEE